MIDGVLKLDRVIARTEVVVESQDVTTHEADGALYTVIRVRGEGPMTSDDPRMEGIFKAEAVMLVDDKGQGVGRDDWTLVDAATGKVKARGTAHGTINGSNPIRAVSIGKLEDGTRFFANARVEVPPPGAEGPIVIEYGGPGLADPGNRAFAVAGRCEGLLDAS